MCVNTSCLAGGDCLRWVNGFPFHWKMKWSRSQFRRRERAATNVRIWFQSWIQQFWYSFPSSQSRFPFPCDIGGKSFLTGTKSLFFVLLSLERNLSPSLIPYWKETESSFFMIFIWVHTITNYISQRKSEYGGDYSSDIVVGE